MILNSRLINYISYIWKKRKQKEEEEEGFY